MSNGGQVLADALVAQGVDVAFCVPGESYLALLDGLYTYRERVRVVTCRLETAAANAAEAYGKLTGRPGVCLVTRGPGATQAAVGVHTARQDSTPLVLIVGQVARGMRGREAFQEIDCTAVFGSLAKGVFELDDPTMIDEVVTSAFTLAMSGRPGPVVVACPEDVLAAEVGGAVAPRRVAGRQPAADGGDVARVRELLAASSRPLVLVGGGPWDAGACAALERWATACGLPVAASYRRQDLVDNALVCYVGHATLGIDPRLLGRIRDCDLLIALGPRLTEIETQGYTVPAPPVAAQTLVHIHPDPSEIGRVYQPALGAVSGVAAFARALDADARVDGSAWAAWAADARADYERWSAVPDGSEAFADLGAAVATLSASLPPDAIVCNGAGNYTQWVHRFTRYRGYGTQLAPQSGAMGYGIPAAVAAAVVHPDRAVVAFAGDGCFQMSGQELATMVAERLGVLVIVANNRRLGTIRMHQERHFPGRVIATDLVNPDFAALARAYGAFGEQVSQTDAFPEALDRARAATAEGRPALLELLTDPDVLTPSRPPG